MKPFVRRVVPVPVLLVARFVPLAAQQPCPTDAEAPTIFIEYPPDSLVVETGSTEGLAVDVAGRVSDVLSGFAGLTVEVNGVAAAVDTDIGTDGTFFAPAVPIGAEGPTLILATARDSLSNETSATVAVQHVVSTGPLLTPESGNARARGARRRCACQLQPLPAPRRDPVRRRDGAGGPRERGDRAARRLRWIPHRDRQHGARRLRDPRSRLSRRRVGRDLPAGVRAARRREPGGAPTVPIHVQAVAFDGASFGFSNAVALAYGT